VNTQRLQLSLLFHTLQASPQKIDLYRLAPHFPLQLDYIRLLLMVPSPRACKGLPCV